MIATVRETARKKSVPEHFIRELIKSGKCPGFYSGNRFYVNLEKFDALLDKMSTRETNGSNE